MRTFRTSLLAGFVFLLTAAVAWPCGGYGRPLPTAPLKLPGPIARTVLWGSQLHAISTDGRLFTVDLRENTVRTFDKLALKLSPILDVLGDWACVAADKRVCLVDCNEGKVLRSTELPERVLDAGFVGDQCRYAVAGSRLILL